MICNETVLGRKQSFPNWILNDRTVYVYYVVIAYIVYYHIFILCRIYDHFSRSQEP